jgi:general secretion pathway protein L
MNWLAIDLGEGAAWLLRDGAVAAWQHGSPLPAETRVVALAPAESVGLHVETLPVRRLTELRQAVPFALEDRLAQPVEALHFALGAREGQRIDIAVVARDRLRAWIDHVASTGLHADLLVVDAHLLPRAAGSVHVARMADRVLVSAPDQIFAVPFADWPQWRSRLPSLSLLALGPDARFRPIEDATIPAVDRTTLLRLLPSRIAQAPDLLQGEFAPRQRDAGRRRLWRWAAVLAVAALLLAFLDAAVGVWTQARQRDRLRTEMADVFRQALPEARMTADPAAQLAAEVQRADGGNRSGSALSLLLRAAPVLMQGSRYRLRAFDYRNGSLELEVTTDDVAGLDALRESLATNGLMVEVIGVDPGDDGVRGRLRIAGDAA